MRARFIVFLLLILCFVYPAFSAGEKEYHYDIGSIDKLVEETKDNISGVKNLSDSYVVKNVKKINNLVSEMNAKVSEDKYLFLLTKTDSQKMDDYLKSLKNMADFYADVAKNEKKIKNHLISYHSSVVALEVNLKKILKDTQAELNLLKREEEELLKKTNVNTDEFTIKSNSLRSQISSAEARVGMISTFNKNYANIVPEIDVVIGKVDLFILTCKESKKVYESAYQTAKVARDINVAYNTIEELNNLNNLAGDIQQSWKDLDSIISNLLFIIQKD